MAQYETVIGLEVHVELATKTKIFCGCSTAFGGAPNSHTCPVCTGLPGSLPVLNKQVVEYAMAVGLATNCQINQYCKFDRKNYFYPDLPKAYQISQFDVPICENGEVFFYVDGVKHSCRLERIHFEEDAGKLLHDDIDGTIVDYVTLQRSVHQPLIARIKIMSNLDIAEHRIPQDGHFRARLETGPDVNVRVSILPTVFGEKAVLRILSSNTYIKNASHFGMNDETYKRFLPLLNRPNGIVYLTGPTGSGKTTTLYMVLQTIAERQVNVSTIEDPVERNLARINQTQVNNIAGLTFESGLRALLRQDPDVIMVGETRDAETASISVRAAITGHMVFSTLHTNDALSSIVRLEDMGVERYMIANSVAGLVAQRLMRRVCPHCAKQMPVTAEERTYLGPDIPFVRRGTGCTQCNGTGYRGRIAIHELVIINRELRELISAGATQAQLTEAARRSQGMTSLREAALQLVREGETTPEELLKITFYEE